MENYSQSPQVDVETLLALTRMSTVEESWKTILDRMVKYSRQFFIFDNIVIYTLEAESGSTDVLYARATGRGKTSEADVSWGETIANRVFTDGGVVLDVPPISDVENRLTSPYILALPIPIAHNVNGALVIIRFGGPEYTLENQSFASFLGAQVASVVMKKSLRDYEDRLRKQTDQARLQNDFINTITHELRSPLGFIRGYASTLLRQDTTWDAVTQRDFLEIIERESNNLSQLIDDLLDSSRLQSGQMQFTYQSIKLDTLIRDEVNRFTMSNPNHQVSLNLSEQLPHIRGDTRRLAQVFDNLLSNAQKFAQNSPIIISAVQVGSNVVVEFSDKGPGIQERYLPHIFTRFFRDPDNATKAHGSGLGLSICKQVIEKHGGEISVRSAPGQGVAFTITLPIQKNTEGDQ